MNKKLILAILAIIPFLIGGIYVYNNSESTDPELTSSDAPVEVTADLQSASDKEVTAAEQGIEEDVSIQEETTLTIELVSEHDSPDDCWFIIDGAVYDVTSYVSSHPGGEAIAKGCGKDATELFATKDLGAAAHGHSVAAQAQLESFLIGNLGGSF
jgi:cytochrome b involved in lipid metabolism